MWGLVQKFIKNESGASAIEYSLIAAGIAGAISAVVYNLGDQVHANFRIIRALIGAK
jgi:pilus assembly protein Flp/PilA